MVIDGTSFNSSTHSVCPLVSSFSSVRLAAFESVLSNLMVSSFSKQVKDFFDFLSNY